MCEEYFFGELVLLNPEGIVRTPTVCKESSKDVYFIAYSTLSLPFVRYKLARKLSISIKQRILLSFKRHHIMCQKNFEEFN